MDLVDLIESHRFLGSEFLVWLWYKCDLFEGRFVIPGHGVCEVWFDDRITLEATIAEEEQSLLKGASPTFTPEAHEALRQGKLPTQAKLRITQDEQEFCFAFKATTLHLSGIKIPALMSKGEDEKFYERMFLVEKLESIMDNLYGEFLAIRLSDKWSSFSDEIEGWIYGERKFDCPDYRQLVEEVGVIARLKRTAEIAKAEEGAPAEQAEAPVVIEEAPIVVEEAPAEESPEASLSPEVIPPAKEPAPEVSANP